MPTTTGANTGTVIKAIAIHSINVPKITNISIIKATTANGERPSPVNKDLIKSAPPIRLYMPTKATAPNISQTIVPTVDIVPARAFCKRFQLKEFLTKATTIAPTTPTAAASVTDAIPA